MQRCRGCEGFRECEGYRGVRGLKGARGVESARDAGVQGGAHTTHWSQSSVIEIMSIIHSPTV